METYGLNPKQIAFADEYIISGEVYGVVYLITNKENGKKYVGITRRSVQERFKEHYKADSLIGRALRKYGLNNFHIETIDNAMSEPELFEKEIHYIDQFKSFGNGYNLTNGGDGVDKRIKVNRQLTNKQVEFIKKVEKFNETFKPSIENSKEMIEFTLMNTIRLYLECEYETDIKVVAKMISRLKKHYIEIIVQLRIIDMKEVLEFSQKKSSLEVF